MLLEAARKVARAAADVVDIHLSLQRAAMTEAARHAHGELLDVGCGDKPWLELFTPHVGTYVGVEHQAVFEKTNASNSERKPDVMYDGTTLPWSGPSFDTVVSFQVLEHTPNPEQLVSEMARVMRPGGTLIISAPFSYRLHEQPYDYFRYTPFGLRTLVEKQGLEVEQVTPFGAVWSVIAHKVNSHLIGLGRLDGVGQSLGKFKQEAPRQRAPRYWALPFIGAGVVASALIGRVGDAVAHDDVEALGYVLVARKR
ncbi:MAG: hypothetical protein DI536_30225 [Archangium gephyra]|uniref:Methyltransferase type 11 domain-containing protein n=1 Tax=Archangium gephyra TaxID=48 RepID=A0A2W5T0J4_9BACT|nr:MAG: hypothetical protein DI536_30225 [Archangium gephyra]